MNSYSTIRPIHYYSLYCSFVVKDIDCLTENGEVVARQHEAGDWLVSIGSKQCCLYLNQGVMENRTSMF